MNELTKAMLELKKEKVIKKVPTHCPRCGISTTLLKTKNYLIFDCEECGFCMGTPRN